MTWFPFVCLAMGAVIGANKAADRLAGYIDPVINAGLVVLMLTLGAKIGSNEALFSRLSIVGLQCLVIAFFAIAGSVMFTVILERCLLPLGKLRTSVLNELVAPSLTTGMDQVEPAPSLSLLWTMPGSLIAGVLGGYLMGLEDSSMLDIGLTFSLVVLYIGVGMSFGRNRAVFQYLKLLSWKVILISVAIILGSLVGGGMGGWILGISLHTSVSAAAGMSYYSLTGAMLTQAYGIEAGVYGFLVNVAREFLTVLLAPFLSRISPGSPIASGAAGNMDTMLVPVTKVIGMEFGLVTLVTGTILTFLVPFLLTFLLCM